MRPAGRFVADVITALIDAADVGVNLLELDELAHRMIKERGAESCYIDYHPSFGARPFGKVLCTSVNDAVLHGLPHDYTLQDGDLLSVDFAASVDGWVSDSAYSLVVGTPRPEDLDLIDVAVARAGRRDRRGPGRQPARRHLARHRRRGPRRRAHGQPRVRRARRRPHHARRPARRRTTAAPHRGLKLKEGLVIAIEPWFLHTTERDLHRPRRLDPAQRRRVPRRAHGAHRRDHRRRPGRADRPRLTPRRWRRASAVRRSATLRRT